MLRPVITFLSALVIVFLVLALGGADWFARGLLFHPNKFTESLVGTTFSEARFQNSKKQTLYGVYFPLEKVSAESPQGTILYFHGNADNVSRLIDWAEQMRSDFSCNVFIFGYAGYGKSEGKPTARGILDDGLAALNYLNQQEKIPTDQIILWGFSLGGSVAVDLASKNDVKGLIVESSFTSLGDMGSKMLPFLPVRFLLWEQLASINKIGSVRCPVFVSHGRADQVIPFSHGERLFAAANEPKTFFISPVDFDFHSAPLSDEHIAALKEFFKSLETKEPLDSTK